MNPELSAGITARFTKGQRPKASLKFTPGDFMVTEIPEDIPRSEDGKYLILKVRLTDWDTSSFVNHLARAMHVSKSRVTFSGTKDKKAVTEQYFCVNTGQMDLNVAGEGIEILEQFRSDTMLNLGSLVGNRFRIRIHSGQEISQYASEAVHFLLENGGFPNFYGIQRFGSIRPITHRIGKLILQGNLEDAVMEYIYDPEYDREDYRRRFYDTRDAAEALRDFPPHLGFERSILGRIQETGKIEEGFSGLPRSLAMMFVHAYQSYVFNLMLSKRVEESERMDQVEEGDTCYPIDTHMNSRREPIPADSFNLVKLNDMSRSNRLRPTLPVVGYETVFSGEEERSQVEAILEKDGLSPANFRVHRFPSLSSKGERRIISSMPLEVRTASGNVLEFSLGKGTYATSFLREIIDEYSD